MIIWPEKALVLAVHDRQIAEHGGSAGCAMTVCSNPRLCARSSCTPTAIEHRILPIWPRHSPLASRATVPLSMHMGSDVSETMRVEIQRSTRLRDPQFVRLDSSYRFGKFDTCIFKRKNKNVNMDGMEMGM